MRTTLRLALLIALLPLAACDMNGLDVEMRTDEVSFTGLNEYAYSGEGAYLCSPTIRVRARGGGLTESNYADIEWSGGYIEYRDANDTLLRRVTFFGNRLPGRGYLPSPSMDDWRYSRIDLDADVPTFQWTLVARYFDADSYSGESKTVRVSARCTPGG